MSFVPQLLQAIISLDGEACVIHVGEKPYLVAPSGQVDLASFRLTLGVVDGILRKLLPIESQNALDEFGAAQYELPPQPTLPQERFTVVVARDGDDIWIEIRRWRRLHEDRVPEALLTRPAVPLDDVQAGQEEPDALDVPLTAELWPDVGRRPRQR